MHSEVQVNILMVDDSPEKLLAHESVLTSLGQPILKAFSGEDALRILLRHDVAVILLVEDDLLIRNCAEMMIQDGGHTTLAAGDVAEARRDKSPPDRSGRRAIEQG